MTKQIKISEYIFRQLWLEKKHRELKYGMTLSYSEVIGLCIGLDLRGIKETHKKNRYKKYLSEDLAADRPAGEEKKKESKDH